MRRGQQYTADGLPMIGASSVAPIILGEPVYDTSADDVRDQLLGLREPKAESIAMARGTYHEKAILDIYQRRAHPMNLVRTMESGAQLEHTHPDIPWLCVHPDARGTAAVDDATWVGDEARHKTAVLINVQAKSVRNNWPQFECGECGRRRLNRPDPCKVCGSTTINKLPGPWGPEGSEIFPQHYYVQVMVEMAVMTADWYPVHRSDLIAAMGPQVMDALSLYTGNYWDLDETLRQIEGINRENEGVRIYPVPYDQQIADDMLRTLVDWYETEIIPNIPNIKKA